MKSNDLGPDWLACFAGGNQEAFTGLLEKHYAEVLLRARRYVGSKKAAEKLTFCAFLAAWRQRDTFSRTGQVTDYILSEQRKLCLLYRAYYGGKPSLPHTPTALSEIEPFILEIEKGPPGKERIRLEDLRVMLQKLEELPSHHRKILHDKYAKGKTLSQIALEEDISSRAAGSRRSRATRYLLSLFSHLWTGCPWLILTCQFYFFRHCC